MTKIKLSNISKVYPDRTSKTNLEALSEINLEVYTDDFLVIIGPSGCGKSTLLSIIAGLTKQSSGEVLIDNELLTKPNPRKIAFMFQDSLLLPWRPVIKNVEIGLEAQGIPAEERKQRALKYLRLVGLEGFKNHYPHQLSGGMRQRVALCRALAMETEILLMDEPFGALDEQTRLILGNELINIWSAVKRTIVFVTHSLNEAVYLSERIAVMSFRPGRIKKIIKVDVGRPRTLGSAELGTIYQFLWSELSVEIARIQQ